MLKRWFAGSLLAGVLAATLVFANGCEEAQPEPPDPPATVEQMIHALRTDARSLEEFETRLKEQGFVKSKSSLETLQGDLAFRYAVFRRNQEGYIHLEFTDVREKADELSLGLDREETKTARVIWSAGLRPLDRSYRFEVLRGLDQQWVGICFVSREEGDVAHGAITLNYGRISWRSSY